MTLEEAIRVHTVLMAAPVIKDDPPCVAALQLAIEALKWVKRYRPANKTDRWSLLPGETKK